MSIDTTVVMVNMTGMIHSSRNLSVEAFRIPNRSETCSAHAPGERENATLENSKDGASREVLTRLSFLMQHILQKCGHAGHHNLGLTLRVSVSRMPLQAST